MQPARQRRRDKAMDFLSEEVVALKERFTSVRSDGKEVSVETSTVQTTVKTTIHESLSNIAEKLKLAGGGSSKDIGWLMTDASEPVEDETDHFYTILVELRDGNGRSDELGDYSYLLVPGLFCNSYPTYFREIQAYFRDTLNLQCEFAIINTEGAVKTNASMLRDIITKQYEQFGKKVILLGHSKGGTDASAACSMYWEELKDKVRGLIMLQSPLGGTPLASDLLRGGEFGALSAFFLGKFASLTNPEGGTIDAVKDLTYDNRKNFLAEHPIPTDVPTLCFHSNFPPDSKTRSTKYVMSENFLDGRLGNLDMELGRELALVSKYFMSRYDGEESDGLVTRKDAEVPGSVVVRYREDLAHALVIPEVITPDSSVEVTSASHICQACVLLLLLKR